MAIHYFLKKKIGNLSLHQLRFEMEFVERMFMLLAKEEVGRFIEEQLSCRFYNSSFFELQRGAAYHLLFNPSKTQFNTLNIELIHQQGLTDYVQYEMDIPYKGSGRFNKLKICLPQSFELLVRHILEIARDVLQSCYLWLNKVITKKAMAIIGEFNSNLYLPLEQELIKENKQNLLPYISLAIRNNNLKDNIYYIQNSSKSTLSRIELGHLNTYSEYESSKLFSMISEGVKRFQINDVAEILSSSDHQKVSEPPIKKINDFYIEFILSANKGVELRLICAMQYQSSIKTFLSIHLEQIVNEFNQQVRNVRSLTLIAKDRLEIQNLSEELGKIIQSLIEVQVRTDNAFTEDIGFAEN